MGIRFTCPNGHQLHVKEFLAGKRGICPECDAKFVIPAVDLVEDVTASPLETPPAQLAPPPLPAAAEQNTSDVWYVRAVSGDQYGPATTETMRTYHTSDVFCSAAAGKGACRSIAGSGTRVGPLGKLVPKR